MFTFNFTWKKMLMFECGEKSILYLGINLICYGKTRINSLFTFYEISRNAIAKSDTVIGVYGN